MPDLVEMISNLIVLQISSGSSECHEERDGKVDDLDPTENGEASEESHGAPDHWKLAHKAGGVQATIIGGRVKIDLKQL